jgi:WD40 repeat protein/serine/threonine protein kinase
VDLSLGNYCGLIKGNAMPAEPKPLLVQLRESGLLEAEQLKVLSSLPESRQSDPRPLAKLVLQRGWLTLHQINQIANGRGKELFIGPYLLLERLGEGGMGQVFKARHRHMGREVALKVIRKEKLASPDAVKRFYAEVRAAAHLSHPNIVLAYDAGEAAGTHFLSMEYVDGMDLARLVKEQGALPVGHACDYIRQAALGLAHAHDRGLVHRDIKPHNLLLTRQGGVVKVLDMGLARLQGGLDKERALTQTGAVIGTPDYLAPEQAIDSKHADARSDLYSLGCTLYFLLAGRAPFTAESLTQLLLQHQMEEASPLQRLRADVPPGVAGVVRRLMAKRPEERYQSAAELAAALEGPASGRDVDAPPPSIPVLVGASPSGDNFWNTAVEDEPTPTSRTQTARRKASDDDRTEAGSRVIKSPRRRKGNNKARPGAGRNRVLLWVGLGAVPLLGLLITIIALIASGKKDEPAGGDTPITIVKNNQPGNQPPDNNQPGKKPGGEQPGGEQPGKKEPGKKDPVKLPPGGKVPPLPGGPIHFTERPLPEVKRSDCIFLSPVGHRLFTGGYIGHPLTAWSVPEMRREFFRLGSPTSPGPFVLTRDGKQILTWNFTDQVMRLTELETGKVVHQFACKLPVTRLAISPDGTRVLVGAGKTGPGGADTECAVHLWDLEKERHLAAWQGHTRRVLDVAFTADGRQAVSCARDGVRVWDVATGNQVKQFDIRVTRYLAYCSPDGKVVAAPNTGGGIWVWDVETGQQIQHLSANTMLVFRVEFVRGGEWLVASYGGFLPRAPGSKEQSMPDPEQCLVIVWETRTGREVARLKGHTDLVYELACSADGRYIVSAERDSKNARLWQLDENGQGGAGGPPPDRPAPTPEPTEPKLVRRLEGHQKPVTAMAFSRDGRIVSSDGDETLRIWDETTGKEQLRISLKDTPGRALALSPDNRLIATAGFRIWLWDRGTGKLVREMKSPRGFLIDSMAFSPDSRSLVGCCNEMIGKWDVASGKLTTLCAGHGRRTYSVVFSADGQRLVTASEDKTVCLWDANTGKLLQRFEGHTRQVYTAVLSRDGKQIFSGGNDARLHVWDVATGKAIRSFPVRGRFSVRSVKVHPETARALVMVAFTPGADLWDMTSGKLLGKLGSTSPLNSVAFSADGRRALTAGSTILVWDLEGKGTPVVSPPPPDKAAPSDKPAPTPEAGEAKLLHRLEGHQKNVESVAFSRDGKLAITTSLDETVRIWDPSRGKQVGIIPLGRGGYTVRAQFLPNGRSVVTAGYSAALRDLGSGRVLVTLKGVRDGPVRDLAVSPDGRSLLLCTSKGPFGLWSLATGMRLASFEGHTDSVTCVAFAPNGLWVASGSRDHTVRLWDVRKAKQLLRLEGHTEEIVDVAISADGKQVISVGRDRTVCFWDMKMGKELRSVTLPVPFLYKATVHPGAGLVLVGSNRTAHLISLRDGKEVCKLEGHTSTVRALAFSPDGRRALTSGDFSIRVWDLPH